MQTAEVLPANARSKPKRGPRCGMNRPSPLTQALDLQEIAMSAARDPNVPPHIKAALMRAWTDLQDVVMAIRGHGRPKPVEARNAQPKRRTRAQGPIGDAVSKGSSASGLASGVSQDPGPQNPDATSVSQDQVATPDKPPQAQ